MSSVNIDFKSILQQYGDTREFTLITYSSSGDEWNPTLTPTETPNILGVQATLNKDEIDGTLIKKDDVVFILYHLTEISPDAKLKDGATTYSIVQTDFFKPGGTVLAQKVYCRK